MLGETRQGKWPHQREFLGVLLPPAPIPPLDDLPEERLVLPAALEVASAPQKQRLLERSLESVVPLLDVAVLVAAPGRVAVGVKISAKIFVSRKTSVAGGTGSR